MDIAERMAAEFLVMHGLTPERFTKSEMQVSRTPDFRASKSDALVLYCEAKHVQHDGWLDTQLAAAAPLEIVGSPRHDPIFNRISDRIHQAAQQFAAVNSDRAYPNVLVFTNADEHCGFADLVSVLTGTFHTASGKAEPIYTEISEGRIRLEKFTIDLYVWFNEWKGVGQKGSWFFVESSPHYGALCRLFGSDPEQHRRVDFHCVEARS